jgi:general secretion pathway protein M
MIVASLLIRRLVAVALLILVVGVVSLGLVSPIVAGFADRAAERTQLGDELARDRALIAQRDLWRVALGRQREEAGAYSVLAPDAGSAARMSMDRVTTAIQTPGGVLTSLREQPSSPGEAKLRVEAHLTLTQLAASLRLLEGQKPFVIIEALTVAADPATTTGQSSPLEVRIDLAVPYLVTSE